MDPSAGPPPGVDPTGGAGGPPPGFAPDPYLIPSPPTPGAEQLAYNFAGVAIALNVISFLLFVSRICTRSFPVFRMGWDDYIISAAWVLMFSNSLLLLLTVPYVFGGDPATFTLGDVIYSNKLAVLSQPIWAWSMAAIKISIAAMLLRLERDRLWRRILWSAIWAIIVVSVYNTLSQVLQCIPLEGAWDLMDVMKDKQCWSKNAIRINSICISSFNIVTDVLFAILPVTFLRKVQIPLRERVVIGILMALGIFAAVASIIKSVIAADFGKTGDPNKEGINMGLWSLVEEHVSFIAACIPCLRSPFQSLLQRFGLVTTRGATTAKPTAGSGGYGRMYDGSNPNSRAAAAAAAAAGSRGDIKMGAVMSRETRSEDTILGGMDELKPKGGEIWRTTEVRLGDEISDEEQQVPVPARTKSRRGLD